MKTSRTSHSVTRKEIIGAREARRVPRKWRKYYNRLLFLRQKLLADRADLRDQAASEMPVEQLHLADAATDEFDRDLAWSLLAAEQNALYEIDEALRRIEDGTYGICEATGKRIPARRLNAIPWTRFCLEVESRLEAEHALSLPHLEPARSVTGEERIGAAEGPGQIEVAGREREPTRAELLRELEKQALEEDEREKLKTSEALSKAKSERA